MKPQMEMDQYFNDRGIRHKTKAFREYKKKIRRRIKRANKRRFWKEYRRFEED